MYSIAQPITVNYNINLTITDYLIISRLSLIKLGLNTTDVHMWKKHRYLQLRYNEVVID